MLPERLENANSLASGNKEVKVDMVQYEKSVEVVEETASDEGWLEANPKGRLGNAAGRKSANISAMASKSVSYKVVAVAPPGTVLKPLMEPVEESNEKEPETQTCSITNETSMEEINTTSVVDNVPVDDETDENHDHGTQSEKSRSEHDEIPTSNQEKSDETNGKPVAPPLAARVPCGPRSPLYYRNTISYRKKQVQHNVDSGSKPVPSEKKFESSSDAIANDIAIIKVLYGDEKRQTRLRIQMNMSSQKQ
ncbi:hypothetical protein GH714_043726 [Hevea brasiliensis]|uniref:Uncharacterized protein n=1 Tax=Hevea brasiliensis TaxID=3981 RepID=A0A6A6K343_HEVBR|nr:hypothetical protein GH714_043726 [Hevea brasiliensis]